MHRGCSAFTFLVFPENSRPFTTSARALKTRPPPLEHAAIPWLLAVALMTIAPHAGHQPGWLLALVAGALLWRVRLWQAHAALPGRWPLTLLAIAGSAGIAWEYRTLFGRDAGVALLFLFMALKQLEMHARRDALVVIMLGFFLLLTHYFHSQSIPTGLWLLCTTTVLTAALIRLHGGAQPPGRLLRYGGLLLLQALPFMLILFLLFPRIQGPLWGMPKDAHAGLTGLSDEMSPGSLNQLIQSGEIAFRVQFSGDAPPQNRLYWRGPVLEHYDGRTWRAAPAAPATAPAPARTDAQPAGIEARSGAIPYTITLEAHNQRWLLALDLPLELPENVLLTPLLEARSQEPVVSRSRFRFASAVDFTARRKELPRLLKQALQLPPGNPQARKLAASWQKLGAPEAISNAALQLFHQEAFFYTLRPPLLGEQAIDDFLFGARRGFCEHFSAAYVFLMRAAGVPARVVTGYQGGEINPVDGYLIVRQSDAHAWAEIWVDGKGWLRVDPTAAIAPARIELGINAALPADDPLPALVRLDVDLLLGLRYRWEAINNHWNQWVLGYSPQRQREALSRLGFHNPDWRSMSAALAALCGAALLLVTAWALFQRRRLTPAQRLWRRFCQRLARRGITRAPWEGPLDFTARAARECPDLAPLVRRAASHYAALHYGRGETENLTKLKACLVQAGRIKSFSSTGKKLN